MVDDVDAPHLRRTLSSATVRNVELKARDPDPAATLRAALGHGAADEGVLRRHLLLWRGVRIHLDDVDGLGRWVELEAVAPPGSDLPLHLCGREGIRRTLTLAERLPPEHHP
jgi:adenylate cyclase class IV